MSEDITINPISLEIDGDIAVATISNPPVNALSKDLRLALLDLVDHCQRADEIKAIILTGAGPCFIAGADVREFDQPPIAPHLPDVVAALEACDKPVIAALNGPTLGGGLEVALGCHYRVASTKATFALPEVTLGIVPGAGGTQRLPRLIGLDESLNMIVFGKTIKAEAALFLGLVDALCEMDLVCQAKNLARGLLKNPDLATTLSECRLSQKPLSAGDKDIDFDAWRNQARKRFKGNEASLAAIEAVEYSLREGFNVGSAVERKHFLQLRQSPEAAALRHAFFAEREASKVPDLKGIKGRDLKQIAVIGAGTMGAGIAIAFANSGYPVTLLEISDDALAAGLSRIDGSYEQTIKKGKMTAEKAKSVRSLINGSKDYQDLSNADLVIEAAFEKFEVKRSIFKQLDKVCKKDAILATNTSYLDVANIANATSRPKSVLGLHFFSPAHIMKLVEIVRTEDSAQVAIASVVKLMKKLGKIGVVTGNGFGFIGNRMYQCYQREAGLMLLKGATPLQVDRALQSFGMAMGPFAVMDMSGIDIGYLMRKSLSPDQYHPQAFQVHDQLVEMGRKGRKTGAGFYNYKEGSNQKSDDPEVLELIHKTAERLGYRPSSVSDEEIIEACLTALEDEGKAILNEGIAQRKSDIDVVFINGYGFPRHKGGPMFRSS